jgi:hypothetical protein
MPLFQLYFERFPFWEWLRSLHFEIGEAVPVAAHEGEEFEGVEVARDETLRLGQRAEEPAEIELVGPDGDVDLVTGEEGDGGPDAVDRRPVRKIAFEVESEAFLGASADGHDDVLRAETVEMFEQCRIGDGSTAVHGRHVDVVFGDGDSLLFEPGQIAFCADGVGHDPQGVAGLANVGFEEQFAEVFEAGEPLDGCGLQSIPDENHEGGVGDGEVGVEESVAITGTAIEVLERGSGGDDEKAAFAHDVDGSFGGAVEEVDAEDAVSLGLGLLDHAWVIFS